jgi:hypothetical protein
MQNQNMQNIAWSSVTAVLLQHRHKGKVKLFHSSISLGIDLEQEKKLADSMQNQTISILS